MRKNIDIFANLTQVAEYHRNRWPTIRRNIYVLSGAFLLTLPNDGLNAPNSLPNNKVCNSLCAAGLSTTGLQIALHATRSPIALKIREDAKVDCDVIVEIIVWECHIKCA